jgi:hypothetical protein
MLQTNKDNSGKIIDIIEVIYNQEIPIGNNIGFWGTNLKDFNKLKTITRNIYIKNMGNKNEIELFEAEIINSGLLPSGYIMAPEVAFKVDLTSFHKSSEKIPEILKMNHPSEPDIDKSKFFATVRIKTKVNDAESLFPHTRKSLWKLSEDNPFILGMESENIKEAFGNTKFKILIPKSIDEIKEHLENDEKDSLIKKYVIIKKEKLISDEDDEE